MFEMQYLLTAAATMIGFVNALPPRQILNRLRSVRPKASRSSIPAMENGRHRHNEKTGGR
jgi:hypothetical protein